LCAPQSFKVNNFLLSNCLPWMIYTDSLVQYTDFCQLPTAVDLQIFYKKYIYFFKLEKQLHHTVWKMDACPDVWINRPLLSKTLPLLAFPATQPWALIYGHPGTCHAEWNGKRGAEEDKVKWIGTPPKNCSTTPYLNMLLFWWGAHISKLTISCSEIWQRVITPLICHNALHDTAVV